MKMHTDNLGQSKSAHMKFGNQQLMLKEQGLEKSILNELNTTIQLITNGAERIIRNCDGVRMGDYQSNFKLNLKSTA